MNTQRVLMCKDVPRDGVSRSFASWFVLLLLTFGFFLIAPGPAFAQLNFPPDAGFREDRILVKPSLGVDLTPLHALLGMRVLRAYPDIGGLQVLQLPLGATVDGVIAVYQQSGLVQYAEHDLVVKAFATPNDAYFADNSLWGLNNIGQLGGKPDGDIDAPEAWDITHDAGGVVVAIIDTGVRATHEDLAANMWVNPGETGIDSLGRDKRFNGIDDDGDGYIDDVNGINSILGIGPEIDDHGHGTHVAGIIGAVGNNSVGVVGVAWRVQIMACKFLNAVGDGAISDAIECMNYARSKGAKVVNASWGWYGENSASLRDAINSLRSAGIIFVAATGNDGSNNDARPLFPASFDLDNIVAVAATTRFDEKADWSNYGATTVDLGAPGLDIISCWNTTDFTYHYLSGTSMATPHVVGACALLRARDPSATYRQIIDRLLSSTDPLPSLAGKCVSGGRLNLQKALSASNGSGPTNLPVVTLSELDSVASESGPDVGVIRFHRTGDTSQPIEVYWTFSGTAVNGSDFNLLPTHSPFPPGAQADLTITPIDDAEIEGPETVTVTLVAGPGYTVGSPNAITITIYDNDQPPSQMPVIWLEQLQPNASEAGRVPGVIRFHRTGGDLNKPLIVNWTFTGTASNGLDFELLPTTSPYPQGQSEADLTITPIDDIEVEGNETVIVTLADGPGYTIGSPSSATVTIADNDQPPPPPLPTVTVTATDASAAEPSNTGTYTISRTGSTSASLTVSYTMSGTAQNGVDYQTLPGSVTIPAGASSAAITLTPIDDSTVEGPETAVLTLSANAAYTIGSPSSATITIADNDPLPTVTVTATQPQATFLTPGVFTITRSGSTSSSLTVNYALGGTARNGTDYQTLSGTAVIPSGSSSTTVLVRPLTSMNLSRTVVLTISARSSYTVGSPGSATVRIPASIGLH